MRLKLSESILLLVLVGIYSVAWLLQSHLYLNWDVSWLMTLSKRLLAGENYAQGFFENNPPMILYLYMPPVLAAKYFSMSIITALRLYVFLLATISLGMSYALLKKIFSINEFNKIAIFLGVLAALFLIEPTFEFGQREPLLFVFIIPYLLAVACRLKGNLLPPVFALLIGIFAGFGFNLKHYFFVVFALVEMYGMINSRNLFFTLRVESLTIILLATIYATLILFFHPGYLYIVAPWLFKFYYPIYHSSLLFMFLFYLPAVFCWLPITLYVITYRENPQKILSTVLLMALLGLLVAYGIQHVAWHYHLEPAFDMAVLLIVLILIFYFEQNSKSMAEKIYCGLLGGLLLALPVYLVQQEYVVAVDHRRALKGILTFLQANAANKPVTFFSTTAIYAYPAVDYSHAISVDRSECFGWLPTIIDKNSLPQYKDYFINFIADGLNAQKPEYVFVDDKEKKDYLENLKFKFDYLPYLNTNQKFRAAWKPYHYMTTLQHNSSNPVLTYKLDVYRRES